MNKTVKTIALSILAVVIWTGLSLNQQPNGSFSVTFSHAEAKNSGKSDDRGNKGSNRNEKAGPKDSEKAGARNARAELKALNSLNRNINGLLNSDSPNVQVFRSLFFTDMDVDGDLMKKEDVENLAELLGLASDSAPEVVTAELRWMLSDLSPEAVSEVESMLTRLVEEYQALPVDDEGQVIPGEDDEDNPDAAQ